MVPTECRSLSSPNRVRCFGKNALVEDVAREKWDLIRIECTQPFNKNIQYGLKFIKIHALQETDEDDVKKPMQLGRFKLREDSPDSDKETSSKASLFSRWKETRQDMGNSTQHSSEHRFFFHSNYNEINIQFKF
jgi:DNA-repair protein XRCC1